MPTSYAPTATPGDTRRRSRYIGIRIPHDAAPTVEVLEQDVIKLKDGTEKVLQDLGPVAGIPLIAGLAIAETFPARNPITDEIIPDKFVTAGDAFAVVYAVVRGWQLARDAQEEQS